MSLAKLYEDKYTFNFKPVFAPTTNRPNSYAQTNATPAKHIPKASLPPLLLMPNTKPLTLVNRLGIKRKSAAEMQLRKEKGLCYWCDKKFSFNHKCPNRKLMLLACDDTVEESTNIKNADKASSADIADQKLELEEA